MHELNLIRHELTDRLRWGMIILFPVIVFTALFSAARFAHPNCEGLLLSLQARDLGIKTAVLNMLVDFDGRYFTNLLHSINPLAANWISGYKLVPLVNAAVFVVALFFLLIAVSKKGQYKPLLLLSLYLGAIYFVLTPALSTSLYIMIGSFVYLWSWAFTFIWLGSFVKYYEARSAPAQVCWFSLAAFFLFAATGTNEMFLCLNLILLILLSVASGSRKTFIRILPLIVVGGISIAFAVSCPGVENRFAVNHSEGASFIYLPAIKRSISDYLQSMIALCRNGLLLFALAAVYPIVSKIELRPAGRINTFLRKKTALIALALILISYSMTLAFYVPMQKETMMPLRVFSVAEVLQIAAIALLLYAGVRFFESQVNLKLKNALRLLPIFMVMPLLFLTHNNFSGLVAAHRDGSLQKFDAAMLKRYKQLQTAASTDGCYKPAEIEPIINYPELIFYISDIRRNRSSNNWNRALEAYFGLDEVYLAGDTIRKYTPDDYLIGANQVQHAP